MEVINKKLKILVLVSILLIIPITIYGCTTGDGNAEEDLKEKDQIITDLTQEKEDLEVEVAELKGQLKENYTGRLLYNALYTVELLKDKNMDILSEMVHPSKGVRFSPYFYIDKEEDVVLSPEEVKGAFQNEEIYTWGNYDGSGEPIELTIEEYYHKFIYDEDFISPHLIGNNTSIGEGNIIDNLNEVYPDASFVEFHFEGIDPQYEGIDWRSLKLVFEEYGGTWYLIGIIHGQWTV
ncbi:tropomyosin [Alkaliphilus serpentinus]|uniref:Uncharacterized protein n=1 Tax=Alkaliphilus serpentinus TaxID=1482731 RepID=A0A833HR39_9FIRM|nr:hypothetical protein [Alkaliphilus serpentinus]KAB3532819.1 hypothetical protein F8153_01775 [Alkaliphilus serpentinus]